MTVLVLGNITIDLIFRTRYLPRPGETVLADRRDIDIGGKGANQAVIAGRFGADVRLVAPIGSDADGRRVRKQLAKEPIDLGSLLTFAGPTDQSVITVDHAGENCIVSSHSAAASVTPEQATAAARDLGPGDWLVVQGNLGAPVTLAALKEAKRRGAGTLFNAAPIHWDAGPLLPFVDLAVVNRMELLTLTRTDDADAGGQQLRTAGVGRVVVTLGGDGIAIVGTDGITRLAADAARAVDSTGAGDTFCGALVAGLAAAAKLTTAARLGLAAAALTVARAGTHASFPTVAEAQMLRAGMLARVPR